jgi:signal transduction histidine kinase
VQGGDGGAEGGGPRDAQSLVATMVHDLRNPLAALAGNLELLREELSEQALTPTAERSLADCAALITRALTMVSTIGDADALAAGAVVVRRSAIRLAPEVAAALATVDAAVQTRRLTIERAVPEELAADVDARLIGRVLQNLLDNAVRYTPRGGRVAIRAARDGGEVVLAVGNTGPALADGDRLRVFERDFRSVERVDGARRGGGLGLYFCRLVAEAHGGSIGVESRPELPIEFVLRLPA